MAQPPPAPLLWVDYSGGRPDKPSKKSLGLVRKHVMDNYFRQQGKDPRRHHPLTAGERSQRKTVAKPRPNKKAARSSKDVSQASPSSSSSSSSTSPTDSAPSPLDNRLAIEQTDPFEALPMPHTISRDELLRWTTRRPDARNWELDLPWLQGLDTAYSGALWNISMADKGAFHIMLCIGQARRSKAVSKHDSNTLLYHQTQVIAYINERLSEEPQTVDDTVLMLVSSLARISLADEEPELANTSMKAVRQALRPRASASRAVQWRVITWTDLRLASTLMQHPHLEYYMDFKSPESYLPDDLEAEAVRRTAITIMMTPAALPEEATELLHRLHIASIIFAPDEFVLPVKQDVLLAVQDIAYQTVYRLCVLVADRVEHRFNAPFAVLLGMRLYVWTCVPEYCPEEAQIKVAYAPFVKRISEQALDKLYSGFSAATSLSDWWIHENGGTLECLLWILFVSWSIGRIECINQKQESMRQFHATDFFLQKMKEIMLELDLHGEDNLKGTLKRFPWADHFFLESFKAACLSMGVAVNDEIVFEEFLSDEALSGGGDEHDTPNEFFS